MVDFGSGCPWGRENRTGQGRRAKFMHECMDEPEDVGPATICSAIRVRGGLGSVFSAPVAVLDLARGDLVERDLEVVLGARVHHRRRVLVERPLTEVVVV